MTGSLGPTSICIRQCKNDNLESLEDAGYTLQKYTSKKYTKKKYTLKKYTPFDFLAELDHSELEIVPLKYFQICSYNAFDDSDDYVNFFVIMEQFWKLD